MIFMESDNTTFLEVTNIIWDQTEKNKKELPEDLELQWNGKVWNDMQVSDWLSEYFKVKVNSLNVKELDNQAGGG